MTQPPRLEILHRLDNMLVHSWDEHGLVVSRKNTFYRIADLERPAPEVIGRIPWTWRRWPAHVRIVDRVLKYGILQVHGTRAGIWLVADGHGFWRVDVDGAVEPVPGFSRTRPMNRGICESCAGVTYVADYVPNNDRTDRIRIHGSRDLRRFHTAWEFAAGEIRHVHALIPDPVRDRIWVLTGDVGSESRICFTDDGFATLETLVQAGQRSRAVDLIIDNGRLLWGMDSPLETPEIITVGEDDPAALESLLELPGPSYYAGRNAAGACYLGVTAERGPACEGRIGAIYATDRAGEWSEINRGRSDFSPQYGIFYFPKGIMPDNYLVFSQRALVPHEGCLTIARDRAWA